MIDFVRSTVSRYPTLSLKLNKGEDRIIKSGIKGSLWVKTRYKGYRLQTTGEVASILDNEIERIYGKPVGAPKGYKFWYVNDYQIVETIIDILGKY